MNKKGETNAVGWVFVVMIGVIVGVVLLQTISNQVANSTTVSSYTNVSYTSSVTPNGTVLVTGRDGSSLTSIKNASGVTLTNNFTLVDSFDSSGNQVVYLKTGDRAVQWNKNGTVVYLTYTVNPDGYMSDGGSRTALGLVVLFSALGIAIYAFRSEAIQELMGR